MDIKKLSWMLAFIHVVKNSTADTWHELPERAGFLLDSLEDKPS